MSAIARFSDEWIERVKSSVDIVSVIEKRVDLKPSGRNYVGLCPFHDEKTPSFTVNQEKQFFYCFGCGTGGNVINFIMRSENLSFPEALVYLARKSGIPVPSLSPQQQKIEEKKDRLRKINHLAAQYYYRNLRGSFGKTAREYLKGRSIDKALAREFFLGYAGEGWNEICRFLESRGINLQDAEEAGLIYQGRRGYVDRFRNRIIFPICDHLGRFVGFGGRIVGDNQPKYLNTPETLLFHKGSIIYGLNWSKESIKEKDRVIIVEGYTDCIALSAKGQKNTVASLGTAFTEHHARLLMRFTNNAVIAFDGDAAGEKGTLRGLEILRDHGMQVRVAELGDGQDPDSFARTHSADEVQQWLSSAQPLMEYQINKTISKYDIQTTEGKLSASQELVSILSQLENAVARDEYIRYAAQQLRVSEQALRSDVLHSVGKPPGSGLPPHIRGKNRHNNSNLPTSTLQGARQSTLPSGDELVEREILRWLLHEPGLMEELMEEGISVEDFEVREYRHLFSLMIQNRSDAQGASTAENLCNLGEPNGKWEEYLSSFRIVLWRRRLEKIEEKLSSLENERKGFDIHMELYRLLRDYYRVRSAIVLSIRKGKNE